MSKVSLNTLKNWFKNGLKPSQEQFWNWMDSYWHKDEKIPIGTIEGLDSAIAEKADTEQFANHVNDTGAHGMSALKTELENQIASKTSKGSYEGTSKDLKNAIDANTIAINQYTPPEYGMSLIANKLTLLKNGQKKDVFDLSVYLDNLPRIVSGSLNTETGIVTFTRDDETTFKVDLSGLKDRITALERKTIIINGNEFRFLGANSQAIQINDLAVSGIFEVEGVQLFGDLKCIDNTGDLTTGIETKWKPINKIII